MTDSLTPECEYFVLDVNDEYLRVVDDRGEPILYAKALFEMTDCAVPPGWLFEEGQDGDYYLSPRLTAAPGFYEDYFWSDGDTQAQLAAHAALRKALESALAWGEEQDRRVLERDMERLAQRERYALERPGRR